MNGHDFSIMRFKALCANQVRESACDLRDHHIMHVCYFRKVPGVRNLLSRLHHGRFKNG
jgi:hypothetical protein